MGQRTTRPHRYINPQPERILDAPEMAEDFYVNVLDWGPKNQVHHPCLHGSTNWYMYDSGAIIPFKRDTYPGIIELSGVTGGTV